MASGWAAMVHTPPPPPARYTLAQQLADAITDELARVGLAQSDLARLAGYTPKHLSQMLTGRATGTLEAWDALAAALSLEWRLDVGYPGHPLMGLKRVD